MAVKLTKPQKGFTLIELLIVIAVLGILAVAVLSAINPIEQINRSKDTGSRSDAEQLLSAVDRYYASKNGIYPWQKEAIDPEATGWIKVDNTLWKASDATVLNKLSAVGTGELKASFTNRIVKTGYNFLYAYNGGNPGDSLYLCFEPKSSAFQTESGDRCSSGIPGDFPASACPSGCAASKTCWSCLP